MFDSALAVALSADGQYLAAGDTSGRLLIWQVETGVLLASLMAHQAWIRDLAFLGDSHLFASAGSDRAIHIWDWNGSRLKAIRTLEGHRHEVWSIAASKCGQYLVSGSDDSSVKIWDINRGQCLQTLDSHQYPVRFVALSPSNDHLITFSVDQQVHRCTCPGNPSSTKIPGKLVAIRCEPEPSTPAEKKSPPAVMTMTVKSDYSM
ncbi:MAG: WD40 repeat domain-containing protein [Acaryochloridaceae cyanobacterium RL_2_7]|nr:WD40 repeat domain-containing protein [Acaryochloridaceae cyanobacterium RL_2_7]